MLPHQPHNVSRLLLGSPSASGFRFHFNDLPTSAAVVDREGSTVAAALNGVTRTKTGVSLNGAAGDSNSNIVVSNHPELGGDMTIILVAKRTSTEGAASTSNCLFDISNGFETNNIQLCASSSDSTKLIFQVHGARGAAAEPCALALPIFCPVCFRWKLARWCPSAVDVPSIPHPPRTLFHVRSSVRLFSPRLFLQFFFASPPLPSLLSPPSRAFAACRSGGRAQTKPKAPCTGTTR